MSIDSFLGNQAIIMQPTTSDETEDTGMNSAYKTAIIISVFAVVIILACMCICNRIRKVEQDVYKRVQEKQQELNLHFVSCAKIRQAFQQISSYTSVNQDIDKYKLYEILA